VKKIDFLNNKFRINYTKMNDNTNSYLNNLYTHLNNNQYYTSYQTSIESQTSHTSSSISKSVYEKLLHDFNNYRP
jgi:hypothetical protein